jgi:hypothetical protein
MNAASTASRLGHFFLHSRISEARNPDGSGGGQENITRKNL